MRLILVRHGQTAWNQDLRIQGCRSDTELSQTGREQADRVASWLAKQNIDAAYSSPLKRALHTAETIARACHVEVRITPDLREIDAGELEGLPGDQMGQHAQFWAEWMKGNTALRLPGGESLDDLQQRAWQAILEIAERHPSETVVVTGHLFVNLAIVCRALGIELGRVTHMRQDPACVNVLDISQRANSLLLFNDTCHLEAG